MTTTTHATQIIIDEEIPAVRIIREFDASPDQVFRAHVDPDLFVQWVGPDSLESTQVDTWDARNGGSWRYVSRQDGDEHWFRGCFHELRPGELIVQTFSYEPWPDAVALERLELTDLGDGRTRLVATSLVDSFEARDAFVASGMEVGVEEGYRSLDDLLASSGQL